MDFEGANAKCRKNRESVLASKRCGCFHCVKIFPAKKITEWIDDGQTAICPECGTDTVLGSKSGYPIRMDFLEKMNERWFK